MISPEDLIDDDEKILWQESILNPANKKNIRAIRALSRISLFLLGPITILFAIGLTIQPILLIEAFLLTIFSIMLGLVSLGLYMTYHRYMKKLHLSFKQIKNYKDSYIITDKRLIIQCLEALNINKETFPLSISLLDDIILINLSQIKSFFTQRQNSFSSFYLGFDIEFQAGQGIFIPYEVFPQFIKILSKQIPIKREVIKNYRRIFYFKE